MTYLCQDDGCTYLSGNEHYRVHGYVTLKVYIDFETSAEPGDARFDRDLDDAISDVLNTTDYEIEDDSSLDYDVEDDDYYD